MNKLTKILLSIIGGMDITFTIFSPIIIGTIWIKIVGLGWSSYFIFGLGLFATIFRAIKIGWLKEW